ncbi:MAG: glycosyltransferase family 4 protein [Gaiellaceae bacterium]
MPGRRRLLLASQPLSAGVPRHVLDLVDGLRGTSWDVDVACPPSSTLWRALQGRGDVRLHELGGARRPSPADAASLARLVRLVRRADVVHVHSAKAGFLGRLAAALAGRTDRVVFTPHAWSFWAVGGAEARAYLRLERLAARWCRTIVAVSADERAAGLAAGVGRTEQYRVIPNGVDVSRFALPREPVRGRVLSLGRLAAQKRPDIAVRAFARVRERMPHARLELASDGPLRAQVEQLVSALGIADSVELLGYRDDVPELLSRAAALVVASDYEAAPLTVLEGMAAGVPVVATRAGGVEEALGDTGLVVPTGDAEALADTLGRVLSDDALARRLGESARRRVQGRFTHEQMVADTLALYDEVAGG